MNLLLNFPGREPVTVSRTSYCKENVAFSYGLIVLKQSTRDEMFYILTTFFWGEGRIKGKIKKPWIKIVSIIVLSWKQWKQNLVDLRRKLFKGHWAKESVLDYADGNNSLIHVVELTQWGHCCHCCWELQLALWTSSVMDSRSCHQLCYPYYQKMRFLW